MKKRFFVLMLLVGALSMTLTSCNEDILPDNGEGNEGKGVRTVKLGVQIESGTKVTLSNDATPVFAWEVGDKIGVWVGTSSDAAGGFQEFTVSEEGGKKLISGNITDGKNRFNYAVFPSGIFSYSGGSLTVTLPHTYALSEVSGTKTPLPMVAINDNTKDYLTFYNVGGMLRLTVKSIPNDATGLVIQFPGNKVNGTFAVTNPGSTTPSIATGVPANGEDKITVNFAAGTATEMTLNIPLPTSSYEDVYITPVGGSTKVAAVRHINAASYNATRAHGKTLTATLVSFTVWTATSEKPAKKVIFAPGNLQATYNASTEKWTWGFAASQYVTIGSKSGNTTIATEKKEATEPYAKLSNNGTVDLFCRSTSETYYGIATSTTSSYYSGGFVDWGNNNIDGNGSNYWFTLSELEWGYLTGRANGSAENNKNICRSGCNPVGGVNNALATKAIISDINIKGFIIFPDNYSGLTPSGVTWNAGSIQDGTYKNGVKGFATTIATTTDWDALESEGCVFLPVTGTRVENGVYFSFSSQTDWSLYSSSTGNKVLRFNDDGFDPWQAWNQYYGVSVRLAHEL